MVLTIITQEKIMLAQQEKKNEVPTHITGVSIQHRDTPNPTQSRTLIHVSDNAEGRQYVSLAQNKDSKNQLTFFTDDWDFIKKQIDELIGKKRLLK